MARDSTQDVEREIRLAVVMYGSVSLAICVNGVAQELLRRGGHALASSESQVCGFQLNAAELISERSGTAHFSTQRIGSARVFGDDQANP
jgi:hypothetical protein